MLNVARTVLAISLFLAACSGQTPTSDRSPISVPRRGSPHLQLQRRRASARCLQRVAHRSPQWRRSLRHLPPPRTARELPHHRTAGQGRPRQDPARRSQVPSGDFRIVRPYNFSAPWYAGDGKGSRWRRLGHGPSPSSKDTWRPRWTIIHERRHLQLNGSRGSGVQDASGPKPSDFRQPHG